MLPNTHSRLGLQLSLWHRLVVGNGQFVRFFRDRLAVHFGLQNNDVAEITVLFVVVEAIPNDELIGILKQ